MNVTLRDLADLVGAALEGDGTRVVSGLASIGDAGPGEVTFAHHPKYIPFLDGCKAGAVIVSADIRRDLDGAARAYALIVVDNPYLAMAKVARLFEPPRESHAGIEPGAFVAPGAKIARDAEIRAGAVVCEGAVIGERSVLHPGVYVGPHAVIGRDTVLHPHAVVREDCRIGDRVTLHAGVVVGSDGFGYAWDGRQHLKIPQRGIVVIEDDVEIGANATIDRATFGETRIGQGTKLDNQVHVGHNVVIGENVLVAAQTGFAGSSRVGAGAAIGGQVGVIPHVTIGAGARVVPQSGVVKDVAAGETVAGSPAMPHRVWLRVVALLPKLPERLRNAVKGRP